MLKLNSVMVGTTKPQALAKFYEKVLGRSSDMEESGWYGWQVGETYLSIGEHPEMKGEAREPGRLMFNFETEEVQQEFFRLKSIGAKVVKEPYQLDKMWIATLADPDGNYFQLMSPWTEK